MKKSFGQHLLVDKNYLRKIIESIDLKPSDIVLEIGSGTGLLTCELAKKVKKVFAVEPERDIVKKLRENIKSQIIKNIEIIQDDFLKLSLLKLTNSKFKIIGNIPYNITSKILLKIFGEIDMPAPHLKYLDNVHLMLQLEVAKRLVAKVGTKAYSPLTLLVNYFAKPKILFIVSRNSFFPVPKVDSAFVEFEISEKMPTVKDSTLLKNIIRTTFQQRRKKIINSLDKLIKDKVLIRKIFTKLGLDESLRAENLSLENYIEISNELGLTQERTIECYA